MSSLPVCVAAGGSLLLVLALYFSVVGIKGRLKRLVDDQGALPHKVTSKNLL